MGLALVADMFGAPAAIEKAELGAVVTNPARAIDDVGGEETAPEIRRASENAIKPAKRPERLTVTVPLAVVLIVRATVKGARRQGIDHFMGDIEHGWVT